MALRCSILLWIYSPHYCNVQVADRRIVIAPAHGFDLLSSLVSPGLATQASSDTAWLGMQGWEAPMPSPFGPSMHFPGQMQPFPHPGFVQDMQQEDYIALGEDEESYDPEYDPPIPRQPTAPVTPLPEKRAPPIDSQKKAAELRAKLLANRPQSAASGRSNTPSKRKELPIQTRSKPLELKREGSHVRADPVGLQASAARSTDFGASTAIIQVCIDPTRLASRISILHPVLFLLHELSYHV